MQIVQHYHSNKMEHKLRSKTEIFLVGFETYQILGSKLPTLKQVLQLFFHHCRTLKMNQRESATLVIQEVFIFWEKAKIPIRKQQHCIDKLLNLYEEWQRLAKNKSRKTDAQRKNQHEFEKRMVSLFDISHSNAMNMMPKDGQLFLQGQRSEKREGCLAGLDRKTMQKEQRVVDRIEKEIERKRRHLNETSQKINGMYMISILFLRRRLQLYVSD